MCTSVVLSIVLIPKNVLYRHVCFWLLNPSFSSDGRPLMLLINCFFSFPLPTPASLYIGFPQFFLSHSTCNYFYVVYTSPSDNLTSPQLHIIFYKILMPPNLFCLKVVFVYAVLFWGYYSHFLKHHSGLWEKRSAQIRIFLRTLAPWDSSHMLSGLSWLHYASFSSLFSL